MYSACVPLFTAVCRKVARRLNDYENYGRESEYVAQYMTKIFVFQFLQDQLYLILTAWVFIPYRDKFEVWLRSLYDLVLASEHSLRFVTGPDGKHLYHIKKSDTPAAEKLESLLLYFVVTGQIINLAFETVIPMVMRYFTDRKQARAKVLLPEQQQEKDGRHSTMETKAVASEDNSLAKHRSSSSSNDKSATKRSAISHIASLTDLYISSSDNEDETEGDGSSVKKIDHTTPATVYDTVLAKIDTLANSPLHEQKFVARVTSEVDLPSYDLYEDYAEMVSQFGYVTFFSIIWPFAPLCAFINNWIELRSDAVKICLTVRRPLPVRAETIGPWLDAMRATSWLASISNALLVYQFNGTASWLPSTDKESMTRYGRTDLVVALVIMIFAEHLFLVVRMLVRRVLASWPCAADRRNEMAKAKMKQKWWRKLSRVLQDEEKAEEVADVTGGGTRVDFDQQVQFGSQVICNAFKIR
ncbi:hypothetical protein EV182_002950 [Spiromyces aspiralis]|uniref:Uncharacterized protein n=1 Tax=Spiromyces aspiralis TaxID=68401 RepID=A0ACC1HEI1_9FUNG|nr:hypothetical protein EV182_002950 [Spiromyces aspiralis]